MKNPESSLDELLHTGYRYALSLSHNPTTAEDLLQDAWVAVLKAKGAPPTKAYLFSAIRSRFFNLYKRERLLSVVSLEDADYSDLPEVTYSSGDFDFEMLGKALSMLKATERELLFLSAVEGYTAQEISALTSLPRGTVLSLIYRSKIKIKRYVYEMNRGVLP